MTEPIDVLVQAAMLKLLRDAALGPTAYPYVPFTPVVGTAYLEAHPVMRAAPWDIALAFTGSVIRKGILQVDAVAPDSAGEAPGLRLAALVAALYPQGLVLPIAPYKLQVLTIPIIAAAVKDAPWVRFPVSIPYFVVT